MAVNDSDRKPLKLLALTRKPMSASYEQRILNYIPLLADLGIHVKPVTIHRHVPDEVRDCDGIWWHRALLDLWHVRQLKRVNVPVLFDYDDPLSFSSEDGGRPSLARRWRFRALAKSVTAAIPASQYLADLAKPYCNDITCIPMACEMPTGADYVPLADRPAPLTLLWLGSASTQPYLEALAPTLDAIGKAHPDVTMRLVAHMPMDFGAMRVDFRRWSEVEQAAALRECHIGLCPMPDTLWTRGKCPYKTLQYMASGMAWVGSRVGENHYVAGEGEGARGLTASTPEQWHDALESLIGDAGLRERLAASSREYIRTHHLREAIAPQIAAIWRRLV